MVTLGQVSRQYAEKLLVQKKAAVKLMVLAEIGPRIQPQGMRRVSQRSGWRQDIRDVYEE